MIEAGLSYAAPPTGGPSLRSLQGWESQVRTLWDFGFLDTQEIGLRTTATENVRRRIEMLCRPSGTRFHFLGLTQDLRPGLLSAAPPGLVSQFLFRESFPLSHSIFLPLTFLSYRIET
jgi:hypothetical protein